MEKILKTLAILCVLQLATGCVSKYKGPPPNFELTGESAKLEVEKFRFREGYWSQYPNGFTMGPEAKTYFTSSLEPVIAEVSPQAMRVIEKSKKWEYLEWATLSAALAMLMIEVTDDDGDFFTQDQTILYYSLLGISIGSSYVRLSFMSQAAEQYNRDLGARFTPAIVFNIPLN